MNRKGEKNISIIRKSIRSDIEIGYIENEIESLRVLSKRNTVRLVNHERVNVDPIE